MREREKGGTDRGRGEGERKGRIRRRDGCQSDREVQNISKQ